MKHRHLLLGIAMVSAFAAGAHGATLMTQTVVPARNNFDGTIGYRILVGVDDLSVTALGFQDAGGDGLTTTHQVGIWKVSDSSVITSATVPAGTIQALQINYRFVDVSPVTLLANTEYFIGAQVFNGGDAWTDNGASAGFTSGPGLTVTQDAYRSGSFGVLNADGGGDNLRWAPGNIQYTVVPEPSTYGLLGAGALAGVACVRRRRRHAGKIAA